MTKHETMKYIKRLGKVDKIEKRKITNSANRYLKRYEKSMKVARRKFKKLIKGKRILVVDFGLDIPTENVERRVRIFEEAGWHQMKKIYKKKLFQNNIPQNAAEFFAQYTGTPKSITDISATNAKLIEWNKVDAIIFSGSPGNVGDAIKNPDKIIRDKYQISHSELLKLGKSIFLTAHKKNIPVIGFCYGHQVVSWVLGGKIQRMGAARKKWENIRFTKDGKQLFAELFPEIHIDTPEGRLPVYHREKIILNRKKSYKLLRSTESTPGIVHGAMHIPPGKINLKSKPSENIKTIARLAEQKSIDLTLQAHPELAGAHPFTEFVDLNNKKAFDQPIESMAPLALELITSFLALHKKFK